MKSNQFLTEAQKDPAYALFESLRRGTDRRTRADLTRMHENFVVPYNKYLLSINQMLVERELTADEITQLFTGAAQGAQASGTNSTMIGRLLPDAIKKKFEAELPKADAGPVEGFEQKAAQAAQQIQDPAAKQTAMQMIQTAMKNPTAQRLVMAAIGGAMAPMLAAAGVAVGGGALGAAAAGGIAGGLLAVAMAKMQGQSWKDAGISGLKGAAIGAGAGVLGSLAGSAMSAMGDKMFGSGTPAASGGGSTDMNAALNADEQKMTSITNRFPPEDGFQYDASGKNLVVTDAMGNKVYTGDIQPQTMDMKTFADLANAGKTVQQQTFVGTGAASDLTAGTGISNRSGYMVANEPVIPGQPLSQQQMAVVDMGREMGNTPAPEVQAAYDLAKQSAPVSSGDAARAMDYLDGRGANQPTPSSAQRLSPTQDPNSEWYEDPNIPMSTYVNPANGSPVQAPTAGGSPFQPGTQNYAGRQQLINMSNRSAYESKIRMIDRDATIRMWYLRESVGKRRGGVQLTQEGINDVLKGATNWLKTKAGNLTQKVTPDKIQQAYKKAGSPTDSGKVYQVLKDAGVDPAVTDKLYTDMGIPVGSAADEKTGTTDSGAAAAGTSAQPQTGVPGSAEVPGAVPAVDTATATAAKKQLGLADGKAAVDQMINILKSVRSEQRAKVVALATAGLTALNKASAEQPPAVATSRAPVTGTPGVQGAAPPPAAPAAQVQPNLTSVAESESRSQSYTNWAAAGLNRKRQIQLIRDFSRFVDRVI